MRLKYQLFLTLLAASAMLIALMYAISSWSFSRGFLDYVHQNEVDRLQLVGDELVERFDEDGNWDWVGLRTLDSIQGFFDGGRQPNRRKQPGSKIENGEQGRRGGPPSKPLILTDSAKKPLFGVLRADMSMQWLSLESDGNVIGYLVIPRAAQVDRQFDQVFEQKQKKTLGLTALAMIFLSGLLSIPLAGRIVKPLLTVNSAVSEISGGNYAQRADVSRKDEIGDLAQNINLLGNSLEQNRDARQRWIAEISHELRTPLAVLRGEIEAVQDGVRNMDKQAVTSLHSEVLSLGRLIDDLHTLSVSDVGALNYRLESLNIAQLLSEFLESHRDVLVSKSLTLTLDLGSTPLMVQGDTQRLEQLFSNLMQNTCRYTDGGGKLHVALRRTNTNKTGVANQECIVVDWFDSTPGVDSDALPKLFDPLFRTESSRNREYGGTGLGLSIAKRIVEAHQGNIKAWTSRLGGLHIQIELPFSVRSV